jgi:hypothetical protein
MIYGKIKIELRYCLNLRLVLVTKKAKIPPYRIEMIQERIANLIVFHKGINKLTFTSLLVNKST